MKTAIVITAAGLMSFGIVGVTPAYATHLEPKNASFAGTGSTSATKNGITLKCKAKFQGNVDADGVGFVTKGSFTGDLGCTSVTLSNLPWKSVAKGTKKVNISNVTFNSPVGNCGPGTLPVKLANGVISFTSAPLSGGCTISGKIKTSPPLSIAK